MNKFFNINNKCGMDLSQTEELFHDLGHFAQNRFGFKKPPSLNLVSDVENGQKPLGKTAYYDPHERCVTIYTDNRHIKDILRSLAHELVHHMQNELGMLDDDGYHSPGYAQKNKQMRNRESEAYEKGNLCMRDWEDRLKQSKPTIYNEWRIKTMSTKKWKNNELMENVTRKFGFKMDLTQLNEASCGSKKKYEEELKEEKECPECKGKGDECKCPDKKELKEVDEDGDGKPAPPKWSKKSKDKPKEPPKWADVDDNDPNVQESKLRKVIRKIVLSEMAKKKPLDATMIDRIKDPKKAQRLIDKYEAIIKKEEDKTEFKHGAAEDYKRAVDNLRVVLRDLEKKEK